MADAADLKSASRKGVGVRIPSWAPVYNVANRERVILLCGAPPPRLPPFIERRG